MKRFPLLLAIVLGVLGLLTTARAQQNPSFSRPAIAVRVGAMQTVNENTGGLAPYVEAQSRVNLGRTPFGLALYGGLSYERSSESHQIVCIIGPCPDLQSRASYYNLTTGIRFGAFPRHGPVNAFIGIASHFVHMRGTSNLSGDVREWERRSTVEAGIRVEIPVSSRFSINGGVLGYLPVRVGEGALHVGEWEPSDVNDSWDADMSRYGFQFGVQYDL